MFLLNNEIKFPAPSLADAEGLLAMGGDLSPERLLLAYRNGIFPWYDEEPILWWCPDPRFVLFPNELKISKHTKSLIKKQAFDFTINKDFRGVIRHCKEIERPGQFGTWITTDVENAYIRMHELGYAHSAEVWRDGKLVGGLYGIRIGNVYFGESMFSKISNASKYAFTLYVQHLVQEGVKLIDCQVYTAYLESLGARMIEGKEFQGLLKMLTK